MCLRPFFDQVFDFLCFVILYVKHFFYCLFLYVCTVVVFYSFLYFIEQLWHILCPSSHIRSWTVESLTPHGLMKSCIVLEPVGWNVFINCLLSIWHDPSIQPVTPLGGMLWISGFSFHVSCPSHCMQCFFSIASAADQSLHLPAILYWALVLIQIFQICPLILWFTAASILVTHCIFDQCLGPRTVKLVEWWRHIAAITKAA